MFNLFGPAKYTEAWYRSLSAAQFFAPRMRYFADSDTNEKLAPNQDPEFRALDQDTRKAIWAEKFNMDSSAFWDDLDMGQRNALIYEAQGMTYDSGLDTGISAAQKDARFSTIRGYLAGASTSGFLLLAGVGVAAFVFRQPIMAALRGGKS